MIQIQYNTHFNVYRRITKFVLNNYWCVSTLHTQYNNTLGISSDTFGSGQPAAELLVSIQYQYYHIPYIIPLGITVGTYNISKLYNNYRSN